MCAPIKIDPTCIRIKPINVLVVGPPTAHPGQGVCVCVPVLEGKKWQQKPGWGKAATDKAKR